MAQLKWQNFYTPGDSALFPQHDLFGRLTTHLSMPPAAASGHAGLVADLDGSSGTPSPKEDGCDPFYLQSPGHKLFSPLNKEPRATTPPHDTPYTSFMNGIIAPVLDDDSEDASNALMKTVSNLLQLSMQTIMQMSPDSLRHHLGNAVEALHILVDNLYSTQADFDKQCHRVWSLQSCISAKERELQNVKQQLAIVTQLCDTQAIQLAQQQQQPTTSIDIYADDASTHKLRHARSTRSMDRDEKPASQGGRRRSSGSNDHQHSRSNLSQPDYRRRLDKQSNNNDWDALVDKIVQRGDQQASIYMQQKLKAATSDQKQAIFEAIVQQAYPLMTSRFGNFLVQRLLEVGEPEQVSALIDKMRGNVAALTCQTFGCHVLQKALDCTDQVTKAELAQELFESIHETITHKHACHIWQKIFEIQWILESPPAVMDHVNRALQGKWTQIALDETGSLVIQHIFENIKQQEKRALLDEILDNIVTIAKGQWGNWVIQHILEHAESSQDRERTFQVVLDHAAQLSTDQFASKVVEKALRTGGPVFLERFIREITVSRGGTREALIDMASDQYGNYVVQWLINHSSTELQVKICRLIKKHMVSLRGSKYGQRVAYLVEKVLRKHEVTTYPVGQHCKE